MVKDREAWHAAVHGVTKSRTWLSDWTTATIFHFLCIHIHMGFPGGSDGKESACNVGDLGSIPGLGRSPGGGNGNPLQYFCLENPHEQKSLVGCKPLVGLQRVRHREATKHRTYTPKLHLFYPFIHGWTQVVSTSWLLLTMLVWTRGCSCLFELVLPFSLDKYSGVELVDCMVIVF